MTFVHHMFSRITRTVGSSYFRKRRRVGITLRLRPAVRNHFSIDLEQGRIRNDGNIMSLSDSPMWAFYRGVSVCFVCVDRV